MVELHPQACQAFAVQAQALLDLRRRGRLFGKNREQVQFDGAEQGLRGREPKGDRHDRALAGQASLMAFPDDENWFRTL